MLFAKRETGLLPAPVYQDCRVIHILSANLSVPSTRSVPVIWPVSGTNAWILVLELVAPMPHAWPKTIFPPAVVIQATLEILSVLATGKQHVRCLLKLL